MTTTVSGTNGASQVATSAVGNTNIQDGAVTAAKLATLVNPLGVGQTWQSFAVGTARVSGTPYTNLTGRPIQIVVCTGNSTSQTVTIVVDGVTVSNQTGGGSGYTQSVMGTAVIPSGSTYTVTVTGTALTWAELR